MTKKSFNVNPRAAATVTEEMARLIESRIASRGEAAPGQQPVVTLASSASPPIIIPVAALGPAPADIEVQKSENNNLAAQEDAENRFHSATPPRVEPPPQIEAEAARADESSVGDVDAPQSPDTETHAARHAQSVKSRPAAPTRKRAPVTTRSYGMVEKNRHGTHEEPYVRKDGIKTRATTMHLPVDLLRELAVHCAQTGSRQSEIIAAAIEAYLK
jgi:hypothetical protein